MANHNQHVSAAALSRRHELEPFTYAPLDHLKASLRLIRVLEARSPEGYIQCEVRHATIEASYICLSYVWGEQGQGHNIILDKRPFRIRSNLHRFLVTARQKRRLLENWLWIDALSIDQTNVEERNHQVQQMGRVFSHAKEVLSWLGDSLGMAAYLDNVEQKYIQGRGLHLEGPCRGTIEYSQELEFYESDYWKRAWITQEVALARQVTLCARSAEMTFELFPSTYFDGIPPDRNNLMSGARVGFKGRSLIYLINWFKNKQSHERQDCVYSLLALSGEGCDLEVDYNSSKTMLTKKILKCCKQSFCLCAIEVVAWTLHAKEHDFWDRGGRTLTLSSKPFAYLTLPVIRGVHPSWTHDSELDAPPTSSFGRCNQHADVSPIMLSREERMAVFLDFNNNLSIVIFPQQICSNSDAAFFEIKMEMGASKSTLVACDLYGRKTTRRLVNGVICKPTGETCQVFFSFSLTLTFIDGLRFRRPCDRVNFQGTENAKLLREPLLRLCY
ncbi:hypothetical protein AA0119_g10643 [Alternaria tenuissima]|jgi:hypothetical protein|uniref:Heterokaryon incompatibility domain-containing protein n=1 Tax=Alternaria tenuissima TaxID=119927 RepID=A0AB37WX68_9PLEO|nr:hypothetical protein AA0115_g1900 [Alternaria tenuissima]RYN91224.1 hypothetical protein AA0119_g10643 [Alternaria tenuissima]RYO01252.1 hypothetical protein AA0120_g132 [Alternaria tenuissima]RYO09985.1 hypothetical protein AA0121_g10702 [Alternaria tenuissima]